MIQIPYNRNQASPRGTNVALKPTFTNIDNVHLIHDNLINVATTTEPIQTIHYVMEAISTPSSTLNPDKCTFASNKIHSEV